MLEIVTSAGPVPLGALELGVASGLRLDDEGYVLAPAGLGLEVDVERCTLSESAGSRRGV